MALKRLWAAYKRYKEIVKIVAAIFGVIAGLAACGLFAKKYQNYHASGWAAFSALCAVYFLHVVFSVRRDLERKINPDCFSLYMVFSSLGIMTGLVVFVTYIAMGANHQEGIDPKGSYISAVWGFMSFKWSLFAFLSSSAYRKKYLALDEETSVIVNS
ncbi:heme transporter hrg1-A [Exaiptasia diaphana]|uniref:Heme transporter hrg1-A n=1 Tax=Exaiptasia diaphana TaxID=2652724 RepID=A0A913YAV7_EXADI|nr:heme transporter hrg1-A [Exaiptasia diaphana]KXJ28258.1 Heme transporter hrg1-A [Exaiptasia diaphana]